MALVVEDGTGLPDAQTYISVEDADAYHEARGNMAWGDLALPAREAALLNATDYMGAVYGQRWGGERMLATQALDWPRSGHEGVPEAVRRACAELALRASTGPLLADQGPAVKSETVGPLSVTYADNARQGVKYALVDSMLAGLIRPAGAIPVVRA